MHEFSIVQSLLEQCEDQVIKNKVKKVTKVVVKIGVLSGVEPDLLISAFDSFKEKTVCDGAEFVLNIQPILVKCNSCNAKSILKKFEYICPECKSNDLEVLDGEDMFLMSLEME